MTHFLLMITQQAIFDSSECQPQSNAFSFDLQPNQLFSGLLNYNVLVLNRHRHYAVIVREAF